MDSRGSLTARRDPGQFRCLVCQEYVRGTEAGHCPRCGFVPPTAPVLAEPKASSNLLLVHVVLIVVVIVVLVQLITRS